MQVGQNSWRAVIAALSNKDVRLVVGELFAGREATRVLAGFAPSRRRRVISTLVKSGIVDIDGDEIRLCASVFTDILNQDPASKRIGLDRFIKEGRIVQYPVNVDERRRLLEWVSLRTLAPGEVIGETEINARLRSFAEDFVLLRRYLVDFGLIERDQNGSSYRLIAAR